MLCSGLLPVINAGNASANQVTSRSVLISTGQAGATGVTYTFGFAPNQSPTTAIQSLKFQACTTALGACTAPHGLVFTSAVASTMVGWTNNATAFSTNAGSNNCTASASIICVTRTQAAVETGTTARTLLFTTITNQDVNAGNCGGAVNCTFFVRMTDFSDTAYLTALDTGTMASSTTQGLTVNATIQETLTFCVGATAINDGTTAPAACASISGTSLSLGTLTSADSSVSPVSAGNGGDSNNGIAELSTNASLGATVTYDATQQSGTNHKGTLRVAGATCNVGTVTNDQCINAIGTTQATLTAGTEAYGMTVAAVNCAATTAYACTFAGNTYHLTRDTNYDGTGLNTYPTDTNLVAGTTNAGYAWDESGTPDTIAASTSPNGPVDREALILKFAATPNLVTPAGIYTALADFVATPTF